MIWTNNDPMFGQWYIQCQRDETRSFIVYELKSFQRDAKDSCIWIRVSSDREWTQYNSLYFSNGVIGIYDPSNAQYGSTLRVEFENPLDALTIERGLCFSFLNQFELGIENNEVIDGIKKIAKIIKH